MHKGILNAIAVGMINAMPLITAAPAMADGVTTCPANGNPGGGQRCSTITNGTLSVAGKSDGSYVHVNYYRKSGGSLSGRVGWERNGSTTWSAKINMSNTPFHYSEQWGSSRSCNPFIGKLNAGGGTYVTPPLPQC
ncbi:hypothetical protein [Streptomyces sp. NRRL F-5135]|uniref:hypothetical protein n=1 Tax=Streptomyces sp. NRRL F-5135 TaxID=1463858 RepID=UPI00131B2514|nr:hypothetical protein [Streptomyces sp. NRRL F-5135]